MRHAVVEVDDEKYVITSDEQSWKYASFNGWKEKDDGGKRLKHGQWKHFTDLATLIDHLTGYAVRTSEYETLDSLLNNIKAVKDDIHSVLGQVTSVEVQQ